MVAVLGAPSSGKTTLCSSITGLEPDYFARLPVEYKTAIKSGTIQVLFKELHLEEEYYDLNGKELNKSDGILGVYNTTDLHTLEYIAPVIQQLQNDGCPAKPMALIAMNSLSPKREVPRKAGENTATLLALDYLEDGSATMKTELLQLISHLQPKDISQYKKQHKSKKDTSSTQKTTLRKPKSDDHNAGHNTVSQYVTPATLSFQPIATFGKYDAVRKIGSGIEGKVYEGKDVVTANK